MIYYWLVRDASAEARADLDAQFADAALAERAARTPAPAPTSAGASDAPGAPPARRLPAPPAWWNPTAAAGAHHATARALGANPAAIAGLA